MKITNALKKAVVIGAATDVISVLIYALKTGEYERMNIFALFRLNLFFPSIADGIGSFIISYLLFAILVGVIYYKDLSKKIKYDK